MIYKKQFKDSHINSFKKRVRILLATKHIELTDKCLETLYWIIHYTLSKEEFANANRMHVKVAKEIGSYATYVGAYVKDIIIPKKLLTRNEFIKQGSTRKTILGYNIPAWLEKAYSSKDFSINIRLSYE